MCLTFTNILSDGSFLFRLNINKLNSKNQINLYSNDFKFYQQTEYYKSSSLIFNKFNKKQFIYRKNLFK